MDPQERRWQSQLKFSEPTPIIPIAKKAIWEIRLEENDLLMWRSSLKDNTLFFDGASKGNPGRAGGGGTLLSSENSVLANYAWGLGIMSNNMAEALALWQGLKIAHEQNLHSLVVFGDSKLIIQFMVSKTLPSNIFLAAIIKKILLVISKFQVIGFYHILRGLNGKADMEANRAASLDKNVLAVSDRVSICNIP